jgi:hypothetical protein
MSAVPAFEFALNLGERVVLKEMPCWYMIFVLALHDFTLYFPYFVGVDNDIWWVQFFWVSFLCIFSLKYCVTAFGQNHDNGTPTTLLLRCSPRQMSVRVKNMNG